MKLTEKQKNCPYCQRGYFAGKSGWQHAKVFFISVMMALWNLL